MLLRDLRTDRARPDLEGLAALRDPERFLWRILPHAARSFSPCILLLPARSARAAAVGYLYCRMLDTYEDLDPHPAHREASLAAFAARFETEPLGSAPGIPSPRVQDRRDRVHLLLLERHDLVDRVFLTLPEGTRAAVRELVHSMGADMAASSRRFAAQGGVLDGREQLLAYCDGVMGHPIRFALRLMRGSALLPEQVRDSTAAAALIQLANVTRDLEKDLERGVAYHECLRPFLGAAPTGKEAEAALRRARRELLALALEQAPAYPRMIAALELPRWSAARAAALLMLLFTDRYWSSCAARAGLPGWGRRHGTPSLVLSSLRGGFSPEASRRRMAAIETAMLAAAATARSTPSGP